jgi:hypothetical protein
MLKRIVLGCTIMLACLPAPNQVWAQQKSPSPIRILVDGGGSNSRSIIEAVRRANAKNDIELEFANGPGDPYDLQLRVGIETEIKEDEEEDEYGNVRTQYYYRHYTSAHALTANGKLLFSVNRRRHNFRFEYLATEVINNINRHYELIRKESIAGGRVSQETINRIEPKDVVNAGGEEMPKEPGVYYKDGTDWILLAESLANVKTRGVATALLTIGLSSVRTYDIYSGPSSKLQLREQTPEFYVRSYSVPEANVAILRLKKVKDQREVQSSSFSFLGGSDIKANDIHRIKVIRISDDFYKLVPDTELKAGEYVLDLDLKGPSTGAYEFGIMGSKN